MKDYPYLPGWRLNKENNKPAIKRSILMLTTHGVAEGEWDGNGWIQYRWSCELKESDVLYWIHLEDLTQLEKEGNPIPQEDEPVSEDLEEAADDYIGKVVDNAGHPGWDWETHDITEAFIAGAEWDAEHFRDTTKKISEDLEEAAKKYDEAESWRWEAPKYPRREAFEAGAKWQSKRDQETIETAEDHAFLAGANWQKEQMMKKSVEGFVGVHLHEERADVTVNTGYLPKEMGIKGNSKVRVIIVKEEEK